jgi:dihydroxyacetone kinase-like predicted kinase
VVRFEDLPAGAGRAVDPRARASVVVVSGDGLAALFRAEGAAIVAGPSPSTGELLAAIRASGAGQVALLPADRATQAVAALAAGQARAEGIQVGVVPIRSPVQALAALAVRDASRRFEDDIIAMAEAAGACRYAEVCPAAREAVTVAGVCRPGDILALVEGEVNLIGTDLRQTCVDLVDRLLTGGGELITLLTGTGAPPDLAGLLRGHLSRRWPFVEVQMFDGGQPRYPLLVGVE